MRREQNFSHTYPFLGFMLDPNHKFEFHLCVCVQYCKCEGDQGNVVVGEYPDWCECVPAARSTAVDSQTCTLRPLSLYRPHVHRRQPDVRPDGTATQRTGIWNNLSYV